jgi:hypothetical protein
LHHSRECPRAMKNFAAAGKAERRVRDTSGGDPYIQRITVRHEDDMYVGTEIAHLPAEIGGERLRTTNEAAP